MILITGATGHLGKAVIQTLLKKMPASQIAALVRDESKAADLKDKGVNIYVGSYDGTDSLDKAMQGIEKVLLISGGDAANALQQHMNVVDAAKKAHVHCIAYTGRYLKDRNTLANQLMKRHFQTEDYIKESGMNYTLFRNILYMDAIPQFVGEKVFDAGINLPAGEGRVAFALRSEMGEAIANALSETGCDNRIYNFTGSESYSFSDVAAALTEVSGKNVHYTAIEPTAFEEQTKQRGLPDAVIQRILHFITDIKNGQESSVSTDLENILGRKPASLKEGLKTFYNL